MWISVLVTMGLMGNFHPIPVSPKITEIVNSFNQTTLSRVGYNGIYRENMWIVQKAHEQIVNGRNIIALLHNKFTHNINCMNMFDYFGKISLTSIHPCDNELYLSGNITELVLL